MTAIIAARNLGFGYGDKAVGRGYEFDVDAGEVFCVLGPNGSGKTTLFKTILGLLPPQAGDVEIAGQGVRGLSRAEVARRIAYVPQAHAAQFPYRCVDMVVMGRTVHMGAFAAPGRRDHERAYATLDTLRIGHLAETPYTRISGGQRQLVLIARALAQDAPAIVMDEPTASLDFGNQVLVLSQIQRLAARGLAIVLSTHNPDHVFAIGGRVALIKDGRLSALGRPDDVLTPERLADVYGVSVAVERLSDGLTVCAPRYAE